MRTPGCASFFGGPTKVPGVSFWCPPLQRRLLGTPLVFLPLSCGESTTAQPLFPHWAQIVLWINRISPRGRDQPKGSGSSRRSHGPSLGWSFVSRWETAGGGKKTRDTRKPWPKALKPPQVLGESNMAHLFASDCSHVSARFVNPSLNGFPVFQKKGQEGLPKKANPKHLPKKELSCLLHICFVCADILNPSRFPQRCASPQKANVCLTWQGCRLLRGQPPALTAQSGFNAKTWWWPIEILLPRRCQEGHQGLSRLFPEKGPEVKGQGAKGSR